MRYIEGPETWSPEQANPFTDDGSYGMAWSCFSLVGGDDCNMFTGRLKSGCWLVRVGRQLNNIGRRLADFIRYENTWGRTVIIHAPREMDHEQLVQTALAETPMPDICRDDDPKIIVHSTTLEAWEQIQKDGELKAASLTTTRRPSASPTVPNDVEKYLLQEPAEYREYIMFGTAGDSGPENIQASYREGRFVFDENKPYEPGVRLYLENHGIIKSGLATRDGLHQTKVHLRLPLAGHLISAISANNISLPESVSYWTPKTFTQKADEAFVRKSQHSTGGLIQQE